MPRQEPVTQKIFLMRLGQWLGLLLFILLVLHILLSCMINDQIDRNRRLQNQLRQKQIELASLTKRQQEAALLAGKLRFAIQLRNKNFHGAQALDQLTKAIPLAVSITQIKRANHELIIEGVALSDLDIATLMENMAKAPNLKQPVLTEMTTQADTTRTFRLKVKDYE